MAEMIALCALLFVLWIAISLMRSAHDGETKDIVTGYYVYPGEFVETGRERRTDAKPTGAVVSETYPNREAEGEGV